MIDINIKEGFYYYTAKFNDFDMDVALYLGAADVPEAIEEIFEAGDFIDISELSTVTFIEITNYCEEIAGGC
jgi:hypothetical protein